MVLWKEISVEDMRLRGGKVGYSPQNRVPKKKHCAQKEVPESAMQHKTHTYTHKYSGEYWSKNSWEETLEYEEKII